jgi:ABC-type nitrate/sulfonate/bicarbonate transport system substrate-binding protein
MRRKIALAGAGAFALGTVLAAPPARAQQAAGVRLAIGQTDTSADGYFAYEGGFFKKNGLNVELTQMRGGAAEAAAVAGNAVDIADSNIITFANAKLHDIPFVAIASGYMFDASDPYVAIAVAPNSPYRTAKDLNGKIFGEPSLGGMAEAVFSAWIDKNGGDWKSIKYVEVPAAETIGALEQGRIAAAVLQDPQLGEERSRLRVLGGYDVLGKRYLNTVWFTTTGWAAKNPDLVRRFQLAINEGAAWADEHPDLARAALEKWLKTKITKIRHFHSDNLEPALIQPILDSATKYGILSKPINAADLIYTVRK